MMTVFCPLKLEEADASSLAFRFELRSGLGIACWVIYSINNIGLL